MNCIGDECARVSGPTAAQPRRAARQLLRGVAIGGLCAGLGYHLGAASTRFEPLATLKPPTVRVSSLAE